MTFNKPIAAALIFFSLSGAAYGAINSDSNAKEIRELKKKITKMQATDTSSAAMSEVYYKHKMAISQVNVAKKVAAYETYLFLERNGTRRSMSEITKIVDVAWECSWIFTDLGDDHMERFQRILEWCKGETNFKGNVVARWKKGQYIKSLNLTVKKDTVDYGAWQINGDNLGYAKGVYSLYKSGVIPFKIVRVKTPEDLFDIPTNCVVRCAIETDRKALGWEWKHHARPNDRAYLKYVAKKLKDLEREGLYDESLVSKYYKLVPSKRYVAKKTQTKGVK